ncbi:hypothetical protein Salat_2084500 [Sesamum alatum]|uniref:Uncharacterized protein n=1 Tax=Sesamum alatum TaxID=300844 RepID=A0AAE2CGM7_9LAMI|nr:hypothetical protein Salat_2084500 [Sesamum alatum]
MGIFGPRTWVCNWYEGGFLCFGGNAFLLNQAPGPRSDWVGGQYQGQRQGPFPRMCKSQGGFGFRGIIHKAFHHRGKIVIFDQWPIRGILVICVQIWNLVRSTSVRASSGSHGFHDNEVTSERPEAELPYAPPVFVFVKEKC